jgi:UDP-2,4-diacetamido-2,4,6-trideoxy-beta-L-altropyranose hydrolase
MGHRMEKRLVIRVDANAQIGMGHLMRCLAFAQGLETIGAKAIFVLRECSQEVTGIIRRHRFSVETIPRDCSLAKDASLTLKHADLNSTDLIVTDLGNPDIKKRRDEYKAYLQRLKKLGVFLITIDHHIDIAFPSDIVINPTYGAEKMGHPLNSDTKFLLGPSYFIFRQEFIEATSVIREIREQARNILVAIGGSDPLNLTLKVTRALCELEIASQLNLCIVLGVGYSDPHKQELEGVLKGFEGDYTLVQVSDNMAELMLWSDLAVTGGGLIKYETAVTGTPSIIISQAANHAKAMKEFEAAMTSLHLGLNSKINEQNISEAIGRLLQDYALRAEMSKKGKQLVDARGIERIISQIPLEIL